MPSSPYVPDRSRLEERPSVPRRAADIINLAPCLETASPNHCGAGPPLPPTGLGVDLRAQRESPSRDRRDWANQRATGCRLDQQFRSLTGITGGDRTSRTVVTLVLLSQIASLLGRELRVPQVLSVLIACLLDELVSRSCCYPGTSRWTVRREERSTAHTRHVVGERSARRRLANHRKDREDLTCDGDAWVRDERESVVRRPMQTRQETADGRRSLPREQVLH